MADAFDPYYQWLGISPKNQPADYYRLLGIERFEANADVIATAADQRMAHVRSFQNGPRVKLSQQILNELAAARAALLDQANKAAYDARLREQLAARRSPARPAPAPAEPSEPPGDARRASDIDTAGVSPGDLLANLRDASRLAALEVARLRLTQSQLPAAYQALGEHLVREGHFRRELAAEFEAVDRFDSEQAAGNAESPAKSTARGRAKLEQALGAAAWERYAASSGPPAVTARLRELADELARLNADIANIERSQPGRVLSPRWLAILGGTILAALALLVLTGWLQLALVVLIVVPAIFAYRQFIAPGK
jgi:hypothetical protein